MSSANNQKRGSSVSMRGIATYLIVACGAFYGGLLAGTHHTFCDCSQESETMSGPTREIRNQLVKLREYERKERLDARATGGESASSSGERFPSNVGNFAVGVSLLLY